MARQINWIPESLPVRAGARFQRDALEPFPTRHDGNHWRLNRRPFIRPNPDNSVRLAGPGTVRTPEAKLCAIAGVLTGTPKGAGHGEVIVMSFEIGGLGFLGSNGSPQNSKTIGYPHILKKISMNIPGVFQTNTTDILIENSDFGVILDNYTIPQTTGASAETTLFEFTPNIWVKESGTFYIVSINESQDDVFSIALEIEQLQPDDPCVTVAPLPVPEGEVIDDLSEEWVALANQFLITPAAVAGGFDLA